LYCWNTKPTRLRSAISSASVERIDLRVAHADLPRCGRKQAGDAAQDGRLARARRPDDRHRLAALHFDVDALEHLVGAERQMHVAQGTRGEPWRGFMRWFQWRS
jgi:hypothetical protein